MTTKEIIQFTPNDNEIKDSPIYTEPIRPETNQIPPMCHKPKKVKPLPPHVLKAYRIPPPEELTHGNIYDSKKK